VTASPTGAAAGDAAGAGDGEVEVAGRGGSGAGAADGASRRVLVVGSYPPVPVPGAAVTLDVVRALIAAGADPVVASPRSSAAHYQVAVAGPLAGRRLDHLRLLSGATEVVLCLERSVPLPVSVPLPTSVPHRSSASRPVAASRPAGAVVAVLQTVTVRSLVGALARFEHSTLVVCGDLGLPAGRWRALVAAADTVERRPAGAGVAGVTPLGPDRDRAADLARRFARSAGRRALGRRYATVRVAAGRARHPSRWRTRR
jgi:hypothetical protein